MSRDVHTVPVSTPNVAVGRHEGADALRHLEAPLRRAGLGPAPVVEMDPHYLSGGFEPRPGALVAYRGDRPIAYMPYALRQTRFPIRVGPATVARLPCRQIIVFGHAAYGASDAPLLDQMLRALVETDGWDVIQAFELPADHPLARYLDGRPFGSGECYRAVSQMFETIQVELDASFERYLNTRFKRKTRYNLQREVRLAEGSARVVLTVGTAAADVPGFLHAAEAIARKTYHWKLGLDIVRATPDDIRRISYLAERGYWRGYLLFIDDAPAAYCHTTLRWGAVSYDAVGYDPDLARFNPGKVLLYKLIEDLHRWRGAQRLEFGRGLAQYKQLFANARASEVDVTLYRSTWYAGTLRRLAMSAESTYQRVRPLVRPYMPYVKRLLQRGA